MFVLFFTKSLDFEAIASRRPLLLLAELAECLDLLLRAAFIFRIAILAMPCLKLRQRGVSSVVAPGLLWPRCFTGERETLDIFAYFMRTLFSGDGSTFFSSDRKMSLWSR